MSEYVKFTYAPTSADIPAFAGLVELNAYRRKLLELQLIGVDSDGASFGNLSIRDGATENFYVTASATGALHDLTRDDCARVVAYNFEKNQVRYDGVAIPSSESLTHAAVYESDGNAGAVIHCHDSKVWLALRNQAPTTSKSAKYGTPEMAFEILRLFANPDLHRRKMLVMGGHDAGIITFGKDLEEAFAVLVRERRGITYSR